MQGFRPFINTESADDMKTFTDELTTFAPKRWLHSSRWLAFAMLAFLQLALWLDIEQPWVKAILLAHLGMFLLWQPLWRQATQLSLKSVAIILAISAAALVWMNWWVLAFWIGGLFALVGGRIFAFSTRWQRTYHLLLMTYLLMVLLLFIAPRLFGLPLFDEVTRSMLDVWLPILLAVMAALPVEKEVDDNTQAVDFLYVLLLFTMLALLLLGSLAFMTLSHITYFSALLRTLFMLALALFVLGILWSPRMGFAGLQASFSRYVLSIGTPLEEWLKKIASAAQQEQNPVSFIQRATGYLAEMPSISGMAWLCEEGHGNFGVSSEHRIEIMEEDLSLTIFTRQAVSPTVLLHMRLLVQVLGHFYQSKRREQHLREITRQQTIYETGARLTHDLKNMLQSLFALTSVAQHDPAKAQPILKNQLPVLTQRIEILLAKLKSPSVEVGDDSLVPITAWWDSLCQRHQYRNIEWQLIEPTNGNPTLIPPALFDCVADNLIENASNKRLREPGIHISAQLNLTQMTFSVSDNGSAVPPNIAQRLLRTVMPSEDGLGVGLYQAARWALQMGYRLSLSENTNGRVCFELARVE